MSASIYIIMARTGGDYEYTDWPIEWRSTEADGAVRVKQLTALIEGLAASVPPSPDLDASDDLWDDYMAKEEAARKAAEAVGGSLDATFFIVGLPAPETPTPAVLAPEGTEDGRSNSPGIDPEKAALRQRVRGLEEALGTALSFDADLFGEALYGDFWRRNGGGEPEWRPQSEAIKRMWRGIAVDAARYLLKPARALLPLPEGGIGLSVSQSQKCGDEGPTASLPLTQHSDGGEG